MNIRPLYDRLVVKRIETTEDKTASGLFIPDSAGKNAASKSLQAILQAAVGVAIYRR